MERVSFTDLKSRLELRFGDIDSPQNHYLNFVNRKQKSGEDFSILGFDLERLLRLAFPECSEEERNRIACVQFENDIFDISIKRNLLSENITSLKLAIGRAKILKLIKESCISKIQSFQGNRFNFVQREKFISNKVGKNEGQNQNIRNFSLLMCGKKRHIRSECSENKLQKEN